MTKRTKKAIRKKADKKEVKEIRKWTSLLNSMCDIAIIAEETLGGRLGEVTRKSPTLNKLKEE